MANHNTYRGNTIETIKPLLKLNTAPAKKRIILFLIRKHIKTWATVKKLYSGVKFLYSGANVRF